MGCVCAKEVVNINDRRYIVRDKIGEGFFLTITMVLLTGVFSIVQVVEDAVTHKSYALKTLTCHSKEDQTIALQEVAFHKQFHHPNILECLGSEVVGEPDLPSYKTSEVLLLLPLFPGGTLHDDLSSRATTQRHLPEREVLRLFSGICEGVRAMHEARPALAHRDLKTANVLLGADGTPVIMDLGSMAPARVEVSTAAEARRLQDTCAERCSMPYRAPEMFNVQAGDLLDERTDIWSLGCVLHALCFFKSPFEAAYERGDSVALAVLAGTIHVPESSPYSQATVTLMRRLLTVSRDDRPWIGEVLDSVKAVAAAAAVAGPAVQGTAAVV